MTSLLIPDLDPALQARLTARAAAHGRSPAEEARQLLQEALDTSSAAGSGATLLAAAQRLFGPDNGVDLTLLPRDPATDRPVPDFS